jgi:hypothetical protein
MNFNFDFDLNFDFNAKILNKRAETFEEFCELAGYPMPYSKQEEMRRFAFPDDKAKQTPRLILGARGYGKTDYITILGGAYHIYKNPEYSILLITKEAERGKEIIEEIIAVLEKADVKLKGRSKRKIYTHEAKGKEPTMTSLSVRSKGLRGRHPDMILMEDVITPDDTGEAERKRVQKLYEEALKLTANVVLIGQPVHKLDLFQTLRFIITTLKVKHGDIKDLDADLIAQKAAGVSEYSIAASYHLIILDDNSLPFGSIPDCDYPAQNTVAFIDPSHKGGDYTAIAIGGMHFAHMIVTGFAFKKAWYDCLDEFKLLFEFFGVKSVCFETNALGDEPVNQMRKLGAACVGKNSTTNKHRRIINAAFFAEHIKLHQVEGTFDSQILQANQIFKKQVKEYEYNAKYDDSPDATAGLMEYLGIVK